MEKYKVHFRMLEMRKKHVRNSMWQMTLLASIIYPDDTTTRVLHSLHVDVDSVNIYA